VRLHIGPSGEELEKAGGVTYSETDTQIVVGPISNTGSGTANLTAFSDGTRGVSGSPHFHFDQGLAAVQIVNDSDRDLVIGDIRVLNPSPTVIPAVVPNDPAKFQPTMDVTNAGGTAVEITNTGNSDVLLSGQIINAGGSVRVTNTGSRILGGRGHVIQTGRLVLADNGGSVGMVGLRLSAQLVQSAGVTPTLDVSGTGDVYLDVSALNLTANPLTVSSTTLSGRVIDLRLEDGQAATGPQAGAYHLGGVAASGELDVDAGGGTAVTLSFTAPGDLRVGTITSRNGDVSLTATAGSITDARGDGSVNVKGNNITLSAGPGAANGIALQIDSALAAN
jgi:hypothetical protein